MRKAKLLIALLPLLFISGLMQAQAPQAFNYQGVIRDLLGEPLPMTTVTIWIGIHKGTTSAPSSYYEYHQTTTNEFGLYSVKIGLGNPISGNFQAIDWGADQYHVKVEIDPAGGGVNGTPDMAGFSQLLAVPFALYANSVGGSLDPDTTNEIQHLSKSGNIVSLTKSSGTFVDEIDDADNDPLNEIQTISQVNSTVTLSSGGGTFNIDDSDADPINEIQSISKSGSTVSLSLGGGNLTLLDDSPSNEIQTLSSSGNNLSIQNGNTIPFDSDPTNELQNLSVGADTLYISQTAPGYVLMDDDDWSKNTTGLYYQDGTIGLGTSPSTSYKFYLFNDNTITNARYGMRLYQLNYLSSSNYGINVTNNNYYTGFAGTSYGGSFYAYRSSSGTGGSTVGLDGSTSNYSASGDAVGSRLYSYRTSSISTSDDSYGMDSYASAYSTNVGKVYGIYARHSTGTGTRYAGYFVGDVFSTGVFTPSDRNLKGNITPFQSALGVLAQLNVYNYKFKVDENPDMNLPKGNQVGLMADELKKTMPGLVRKAITPALNFSVNTAVNELIKVPFKWVTEEADDENGDKIQVDLVEINGQKLTSLEAVKQYGQGDFKIVNDMVEVGEDVTFDAVNYNGLVPVLVKSIQEQQEMILELQKKVLELEKKLNKN